MKFKMHKSDTLVSTDHVFVCFCVSEGLGDEWTEIIAPLYRSLLYRKWMQCFDGNPFKLIYSHWLDVLS